MTGDAMALAAREVGDDLAHRVRADMARKQELRTLVWRYRKRGMNDEEIVATLAEHRDENGQPDPIEATEGQVKAIWRNRLKQLSEEEQLLVTEERTLQNAQLDDLEAKLNAALYLRNEAGKATGRVDPKIANLILKVQARRAALNGTDMPKKVQHSGTVNHQIVTPEELEREDEAFKAAGIVTLGDEDYEELPADLELSPPPG